ncbi:hypothetical protein ABLO00_16050, partial [Mycobacterium tuberculosis]|uniref:hypothetical protein n=1 Tax=Mycobacterium tuberculosis TaxID=1773 RepID=UPI0032B4E0EF
HQTHAAANTSQPDYFAHPDVFKQNLKPLSGLHALSSRESSLPNLGHHRSLPDHSVMGVMGAWI